MRRHSIRDMTQINMDFISEEKIRDLKKHTNLKTVEEESSFLARNITYYQYEEVLRELENVKDELDKLKLDMASKLEEKNEADKQIQASTSKVLSYASSMRKLRSETREVKDERELTELARIEAMKELEEIEVQREEEISLFSINLEDTKRKTNQILDEIERKKKMEEELLETLDDVGILQISLEMAKASEKNVSRSFRKGNELEMINEELVLAKKELETIQRESVRFMASMDVIRNELIRVSEETAQLKKKEKKTEIRIHDLNSKLLKANEKLANVTLSEEKARAIVSNLTLDLVQLKTEIEASKKEKELISDEIMKMEELIQKTDSEIELGNERLDDALQELESVKKTELRVLEELKDLMESTVAKRANLQNSSITISKFEYDYLQERAIGADVIADKKVAAAQAWIEALKAGEREILMKIEIKKRLNEEINEKQGNKMNSKTKSAMSNQNSAPIKRARNRKSITLAARTMSRRSITIKSKKNGSTPSVTLYDNQSIDTDQ